MVTIKRLIGITKNAKKFAILVSQNPVNTVATIIFTMLTVTGIGTACHLGIKNKMLKSLLIDLTNEKEELEKQNAKLTNQNLHATSFPASAAPPPPPSFPAPAAPPAPPPPPSFPAPAAPPPPPSGKLNRVYVTEEKATVPPKKNDKGLVLNPNLLQKAIGKLNHVDVSEKDVSEKKATVPPEKQGGLMEALIKRVNAISKAVGNSNSEPSDSDSEWE